MTDNDFFNTVSLMRRAQKEYFKTRSKSDLELSKSLERQVDKEIADRHQAEVDKIMKELPFG